VFPWILFGLIAVPLVLIAFAASRRRTAAGEQVDAEDQQEVEKEFAEAEAYEHAARAKGQPWALARAARCPDIAVDELQSLLRQAGAFLGEDPGALR